MSFPYCSLAGNAAASLTSASVLVAGFVACAHAQSNLPGGPSRALASGVSLDRAPLSSASDWTLLSEPNFGAPTESLLTPHAGATVDYRIQAILPEYADLVQIDAHSSGNALIPDSDPLGPHPNTPDLPDEDAWLEILVSFTNSSAGLPGSHLAYRNSLSNGRSTPGADILGFFLPESTGVPSQLVDRPLIEQMAEDHGFLGDEDIDAFDLGIGVITFAQQQQRVTLFPNGSSFYFSLHPSCIQAVNQRAASLATTFTTDGESADACSIYETTWLGSGWSAPSVLWSAADLGLSPESGDNVDALEVDVDLANLVFSTQPVAGRSQLQFLDAEPMTPVIHYLGDLGDGAGGLLAQRLGSNDDGDDIDAACIVDPEVNLLSSHLGLALDSQDSQPGELAALSVTQGVRENGEDAVYLSATVPFKESPTFVVFSGTPQPDWPLPLVPVPPSFWTKFAAVKLSDADRTSRASMTLPPSSFHLAFGFRADFYDGSGASVLESWTSWLTIH